MTKYAKLNGNMQLCVQYGKHTLTNVSQMSEYFSFRKQNMYNCLYLFQRQNWICMYGWPWFVLYPYLLLFSTTSDVGFGLLCKHASRYTGRTAFNLPCTFITPFATTEYFYMRTRTMRKLDLEAKVNKSEFPEIYDYVHSIKIY